MSTHTKIENDLKNRYNNLITEVDRFRSESKKLSPETKARYKAAFKTLNNQYETVNHKFVELNEAGEADFEKRRQEFELHLAQMQQHFHSVAESLRGDESIGWAEGQAVYDPDDSIGWAEGQGTTEEHSSKGWPEGQAATKEEDNSIGWPEGQSKRDK